MTSRLAKLSPAEAVSLAMRMIDELPASTVALVVKAIARRACMSCGHKGPCRCHTRTTTKKLATEVWRMNRPMGELRFDDASVTIMPASNGDARAGKPPTPSVVVIETKSRGRNVRFAFKEVTVEFFRDIIAESGDSAA